MTLRLACGHKTKDITPSISRRREALERGSAQRSLALKERERGSASQTDLGTVSKATWGKPSKRRVGAHMGFSECIDTNIKQNCTELNNVLESHKTAKQLCWQVQNRAGSRPNQLTLRLLTKVQRQRKTPRKQIRPPPSLGERTGNRCLVFRVREPRHSSLTLGTTTLKHSLVFCCWSCCWWFYLHIV